MVFPNTSRSIFKCQMQFCFSFFIVSFFVFRFSFFDIRNEVEYLIQTVKYFLTSQLQNFKAMLHSKLDVRPHLKYRKKKKTKKKKQKKKKNKKNPEKLKSKNKETKIKITPCFNFSDVYRSVNYIGAKCTRAPLGFIYFARDSVWLTLR